MCYDETDFYDEDENDCLLDEDDELLGDEDDDELLDDEDDDSDHDIFERMFVLDQVEEFLEGED